MPVSSTKFIKRWSEFVPRDRLCSVPPNTRGIYVLLRFRPRLLMYDVVYIGMAAKPRAGICGRLRKHSVGKKADLWTHFSLFEVWDNITEAEVAELEGLFRQIYRKDRRANKLNVQKKSSLLKTARVRHIEDWRQRGRLDKHLLQAKERTPAARHARVDRRR